MGGAEAGAPFPTGNATMYDTTLGWRFVNPKMEEMGHTDSLGMTAENLAQERFLLTPDDEAPDEVASAYDVSRAQDRFALRATRRLSPRRTRSASRRDRPRDGEDPAVRRSWRPTRDRATPR